MSIVLVCLALTSLTLLKGDELPTDSCEEQGHRMHSPPQPRDVQEVLLHVHAQARRRRHTGSRTGIMGARLLDGQQTHRDLLQLLLHCKVCGLLAHGSKKSKESYVVWAFGTITCKAGVQQMELISCARRCASLSAAPCGLGRRVLLSYLTSHLRTPPLCGSSHVVPRSAGTSLRRHTQR